MTTPHLFCRSAPVFFETILECGNVRSSNRSSPCQVGRVQGFLSSPIFQSPQGRKRLRGRMYLLGPGSLGFLARIGKDVFFQENIKVRGPQTQSRPSRTSLRENQPWWWPPWSTRIIGPIAQSGSQSFHLSNQSIFDSMGFQRFAAQELFPRQGRLLRVCHGPHAGARPLHTVIPSKKGKNLPGHPTTPLYKHKTGLPT